MPCSRMLIATVMVAALWSQSGACATTLTLERKIALGQVAGRIDHMAFDQTTGRLFVVELGNNSVSVVDVNAGSVLHRIDGLDEPQGIGYLRSRDLLVVANAGSGDVVGYKSPGFAVAWRLPLGSDADNVRVDAGSTEIFVGYGSALARLDAEGRVSRSTPLAGHPEAFQLGRESIFVNVPSARQISVVDRRTSQVKSWATKGAKGNFPLSIDEDSQQVLSVFRDPARISAFDLATGKEIASAPTCGDADDLWTDRKRKRAYVSCGDGHVAVLSREGGALTEIERVRTIEGARTSLFAQDLDLLFVAARARGPEKAAIWVFRAGE